jgi:hypothetical protein
MQSQSHQWKQPQPQSQQPQQQQHGGKQKYQQMIHAAVANLGAGLHFGHKDLEVDEETEPLLDTLRQINALGMLTVESQPGERTAGDWGETEQRGYVTGFLPRHRLPEMLTELREMHSGCMVVVDDVASLPEVHLPFGVASLDAIDECCGNLWDPKRLNRIMLTRDRGPGNLEWKVSTNLNLTLAGRYDDQLGQLPSNLRRSIGAYCVLVTVVRLPMCVPDLVDIILKALEGMVEGRAVRRDRLAKLDRFG